MYCAKTPSRFAIVFLATIFALFQHPLAAQGQLPEAIRQTLENSTASLSPLEISWKRTRTSDIPLLEILERIKYAPITAGEMKPYEVRFLCDNGKYYSRTRRRSVHIESMKPGAEIKFDLEKPMKINESETSFDGTVCYQGNITGSLMKAPLEKVIKDQPKRHYFSPDYLTWAGYQMPQTPMELSTEPRSRVVSDINEATSVRHSLSSDPKIHVVEIDSPDRVIRYELDAEKNYAVRRRTETASAGKIVTDAQCTEFVQLAKRKVWLPKHISVAWHTWPSIPDTYQEQPLITETFQLAEWSTKSIEASQFVLDYQEAGTLITDSVVSGAEKTSSGAVSYRMPENPEHLDKVVEKAVERTIETEKKFNWFLVVNVAAVAILATLAIWSRMRSQ